MKRFRIKLSFTYQIAGLRKLKKQIEWSEMNYNHRPLSPIFNLIGKKQLEESFYDQLVW